MHASGAPAAHASQCPHERRTVAATSSPRCEAVAVALHAGEQLVAEHELLLALRRGPEQALVDLAVGAADADAQRPQQHLAAAGRDVGDLLDRRRVRRAGRGEQGDHGRSTAPSEAEPTCAR